jgi:hypothetical protein
MAPFAPSSHLGMLGFSHASLTETYHSRRVRFFRRTVSLQPHPAVRALSVREILPPVFRGAVVLRKHVQRRLPAAECTSRCRPVRSPRQVRQ